MMGAIAVHHTATEDSAWDGSAAVAAMPAEYADLHYCHAWQTAGADSSSHTAGDDDEDDKKSSFKFPHHRKKGGPANIPACENGLSRLEGADVPDGDRAGIKAHLQAHIDDSKKGDGDADADDAFGGIVDHSVWSRAAQLGNLTSEQRVREHTARAQRLSARHEFFRFSNVSTDTARLDIYDEIGFWGVNASDFNQQLQAVNARTLNVHLNTPGGDVFDGIAILNMLRSHPAVVNVIVDGLAASAGSFIAMAGDTITMMPNSTMMIHDASGVCMGNAADMRQTSDLLDKVSANLASIYASKAGGTVDDWRTAMRAETWYSADEAVEAGLAHQVGDTDTDTASDTEAPSWNLSFYRFDGRASAPSPHAAVQPAAPPDPPAPVAPTPPAIDPDAVRAALRAAFPQKKEAAQ